MLIFQLFLKVSEICFQKAIVQYITFNTVALYLKKIWVFVNINKKHRYPFQLFSALLAEIHQKFIKNYGITSVLLAHLSRRLTRWAYSIPMVRRPSVVRRRRPSSSSVVVVRRPHFQTWISLKPVGQSWSNFMCSITGVGERLHKVLGQIGSKLWFPWQQKASIDL